MDPLDSEIRKECRGMREEESGAINAPWTHCPCSFLIPVTQLTQARSSTTCASPRPILSKATVGSSP
jgi:hypothetical protein